MRSLVPTIASPRPLARLPACRVPLLPLLALALGGGSFMAVPEVSADEGEGLAIEWNANPEPDLIGYRVYYRAQGSGPPYDGNSADQGTSPVDVAVSDPPGMTLTGLDPTTDYEFVVTAVNETGESPYSEPLHVYSVDAQSAGNGVVTPAGPFWIGAGDSRTIEITPDPGHRIADVILDGESVGPVSAVSLDSVAANHVVRASFDVDFTDGDGDGIRDFEEQSVYGTDPARPDTDADGIDDGDEVALWGAGWNDDLDGDGLVNLLDADADGDGYEDGEELTALSDPGDPGSVPDSDSELVSEFGRVHVDEQWQSVSLNHSFLDPVVIANVPSFTGSQPAIVRVRNVTATGFEIRIQEWAYLDGRHATEEVGFLVMEAGTHILDTGEKVLVGHFDTDHTEFVRHAFGEEFDEVPVILLSVNSFHEADPVTVRVRDVDGAGFAYRLQEEEASASPSHLSERLDFIAWESSMGQLPGDASGEIAYEVARTGLVVGSSFETLDFRQTFASSPVFLATIQTAEGWNTTALRWKKLSADKVTLRCEEEQSGDKEVWHVDEAVGFIALGATN